MSYEKIFKDFEMTAHPEGGAFKEVYRSEMNIPKGAIKSFDGDRSTMTSIYFLIGRGEVSNLHRIKSDEIWHFYSGDPLVVIEIDPSGKLIETTMGAKYLEGEMFQYTVKAGHWFGAYTKEGGDYSLVGCTVAPGFDFADWELASAVELVNLYPKHIETILKLTPKA